MNKNSTTEPFTNYCDLEPIMTIRDIQKMMPDNYHVDKVDRVMSIDDLSITAAKCITIDESFFQGHFPNEPVLPGVYQIDAMIQTAAILLQHNRDGKADTRYEIHEINGAKFRHKVTPGDVMIIQVRIVSDFGGNTSVHGECYVGKTLASEVNFTIQQIKK